jgi:hypothetical protein
MLKSQNHISIPISSNMAAPAQSIPNSLTVAPEIRQEQSENQNTAGNIRTKWSPEPIPDSQEMGNRNHYNRLHQEWVINTYGIGGLNLPAQHFLNDSRYPNYLREIGRSFSGM